MKKGKKMADSEIEKEVKKRFAWTKKPVNLLVLGLFIGALTILVMRVLLVKDDVVVHHHANFALYINGQRDEFKNFTFYEEVAGCSVNEDDNPKHRVHMHDNVNDVVHVHADGVTWGHFFANLGYGLSNKAITTDSGVFTDGANGKKLTFLLNGQEIDSVANKLISSEDKLLIDYGDGSDLAKKFDAFPTTAKEFNTKPDPASCSGAQSLTFVDRLKRALDFTN